MAVQLFTLEDPLGGRGQCCVGIRFIGNIMAARSVMYYVLQTSADIWGEDECWQQ